MRICAITNVYNESFNLPIWLRHYGRLVGPENCFVVDDGSDDGSTENVYGANRLRLPRRTFDDDVRAALITSFANSLLNVYDWVMYSDCDELLVPDPRRYSSLVDLCENLPGPATTACGVNLFHNLEHEAPLRPELPVLLVQRSFVHFASSMCKTLLVHEPVSWGGGFHSSNFKPTFEGLYLFHLRPVDLGESVRRLAITQKIEVTDPQFGGHHRTPTLDHVRRFLAYPTMPVQSDDFLFADDLSSFLSRVEHSHTNRYYVQEHFNGKRAYVIPEDFRGAF